MIRFCIRIWTPKYSDRWRRSEIDIFGEEGAEYKQRIHCHYHAFNTLGMRSSLISSAHPILPRYVIVPCIIISYIHFIGQIVAVVECRAAGPLDLASDDHACQTPFLSPTMARPSTLNHVTCLLSAHLPIILSSFSAQCMMTH